MSVPPAPPRKNKHLSTAVNGSGHNAAARLRSSPALLGHDNQHTSENEGKEQAVNQELLSPRALLDEIPETIIGENVVVNGELKFDRLLCINGLCTGKLISKGNLIIGPEGKVVGNIENMGSLLIDGKVEGNICVDVVNLRNRAQVFGDITCKSITIDPEVVIAGKLNINPKAPKRIDCNGNEISEIDPAAALQKKLEAESLKKKHDEEAIMAALEKQKQQDQKVSKAAVDFKTKQVTQEENEKAAEEARLKQEEKVALAQAQSDDTEARSRQKKIEEEEEAARQKEEEEERVQAEAARVKKEEEAAQLKALQEAEDEAARKKQEDDAEAARLKKEAEETEAQLKAEQESEAERKRQEEESRKKEEEAAALQNDGNEE